MGFLRNVVDELTGAADDRRIALTALHAAAVRIRQAADEHHATYSQGMRIAADLIDPEAT